jgi:formylglycine-generating enzyme required for sulfatase activity
MKWFFNIIRQGIGIQILLNLSFMALAQESSRNLESQNLNDFYSVFEDSRALIIGSSHYSDEYWQDLAEVDNDIKNLQVALKKNNFQVKIVNNKDKQNIIKELNRFTRRDSRKCYSRSIIYFIGHAHLIKGTGGEREVYLAPFDAPFPSTDSTEFIEKSISLKDVIHVINGTTSSHLLVVFDACYAGELIELPEEYFKQGLSNSTIPYAREFITSGAQGELVTGRHLFADSFINGITTLLADSDGDFLVTVTELVRFLRRNVERDSKNGQHPKHRRIVHDEADLHDFKFRPLVEAPEAKFDGENHSNSGQLLLKSEITGVVELISPNKKVIDKREVIQGEDVIFEKLIPGNLTVKIREKNKVVWNQNVTIIAGQELRVSATRLSVVTLATELAGNLFFDGKFIGKVIEGEFIPIKDVTYGMHEFSIDTLWSKTINVAKNRMSIVVPRQTGSLDLINGMRSKVEIEIDNVFWGELSYAGRLESSFLECGKHSVLVKMGKTVVQEWTINIHANETVYLTVNQTDFSDEFLIQEMVSLIDGYDNANEIRKRIEIEWSNIPSGTFIMGSPESEACRESFYETQHEVTLDAFEMSKYEITCEQFKLFCAATKRVDSYRSIRHIENDHQPATVLYSDALAFAEWMGARLPTEAEWEYACRAGSQSAYSSGAMLSSEVANFNYTYDFESISMYTGRSNSMPVGSFAPNAWGLYDMHGNVSEYCSDIFAAYSSLPQRNPKGPALGTDIVVRGGAWSDKMCYCRSAYRSLITKDQKGDIGFRIVRSK